MVDDLPTGFLLGREGEDPSRRSVGFASPRARVGGVAPTPGGLIIDDTDSHALVIAPTGAGKKRNILMPTLMGSSSPMIVVDVKGELARESAHYRRTVLGHDVYTLDPWRQLDGEPDTFNPLDLEDAASPDLADNAYAMARQFTDPQPLKEAYWDEGGQSIVSGLIVHAVSRLTGDDRSMAKVWQIANSDDVVMSFAQLLDQGDLHPFAHAQLAGLVQLTADQTRSCLLSVSRQHLRVFGSERVQAAVKRTTLDLAGLRDGKPITVYIVVPPQKLRSHAPLLKFWLSALINLILSRTVIPPKPTLLLVDEAAQLERMDQILQAVTLARGYGMRCMLLVQSYAQLVKTYPTEHETLLDNCGLVATFGHHALTMSRQAAEALGDISADQLHAMDRQSLALRLQGQATRIVRRLDYVTDTDLTFHGRPKATDGTKIKMSEIIGKM
jgi:type IV secretion system protein VirD4